MALPDFFSIGAPKAGTTALHAALAAHPRLFMCTVKEPKFFLTEGPPSTRGGGPGDVQTYREHIWRRPEYEALFDAAPPARYAANQHRSTCTGRTRRSGSGRSSRTPGSS